MKPAAYLLAVGAALALGHASLVAQMSNPATTEFPIHPIAIESLSTLPSGTLSFSTLSDTVPDNSVGVRRSIGVSHHNRLGVQGVQFTLVYPATGLKVKRIEAGADLPSPGAWTIDYQVHNARSGSEVTVIAFGSDTTVNLPEGDHRDCFRVVFDLPDLKLCGGTTRSAIMPMTLGLTHVESALANRYGQSAGLVAGDSVMRLAVFDAGTRGDIDCAGGLDLAGMLQVADAVAGRRELDASQFGRADLAPWHGEATDMDANKGRLDVEDLKLMAHALLLEEWPDGVPVTSPDAASGGSSIPPTSPDATVACTVTRAGLAVSMDNLVPVKGLQLAISAGMIPEGVHALPASRVADGFEVEQVMRDGELRLMIFPVGGAATLPGDGPILTIPFTIDRMPSDPAVTALAVGDGDRRLVVKSAIESGIASVDDRAGAEGALAIEGAPNPSAGTFTLRYAVARRSTVTIALHDALGREVARPLDGASTTPGEHTIGIDASALPAGMYICTIASEDGRSATRVAIVR
jgi:hypothetical protein